MKTSHAGVAKRGQTSPGFRDKSAGMAADDRTAPLGAGTGTFAGTQTRMGGLPIAMGRA